MLKHCDECVIKFIPTHYKQRMFSWLIECTFFYYPASEYNLWAGKCYMQPKTSFQFIKKIICTMKELKELHLIYLWFCFCFFFCAKPFVCYVVPNTTLPHITFFNWLLNLADFLTSHINHYITLMKCSLKRRTSSFLMKFPWRFQLSHPYCSHLLRVLVNLPACHFEYLCFLS